jgi:MFS family permease
MGSAFFVGWLIGLLFIPRLADQHGRRKIFIFGLVLGVFNYVGVIFTQNLTMMTCLFGMNGFIMSMRESLGYVFMMEFVPCKYHSVVGTL